MSEFILMVGVLIITLVVCFALVRSIRHKSSGGGLAHWQVTPNQQNASRAYTGYGKSRPEGSYRIPLQVIESPDEFDNTPKRKRSTRYFERE